MARAEKADSTRLTDDQLDELTALLGDVDAVEIKLTVPAQEHRATVASLPLDPVESEPRQVFFFDTPRLDLNRAGIVVRARRIAGGGADTVVKLRPVDPRKLSPSIRHSGSFKVEVDCLPGGFVCSGSFKGKADSDEVREVAAGRMELGKLLSREQRDFFRKHAPKGVALDSLSVLGPIFVLKNEFKAKKLDLKMVAEMWLYPDGARLLELSAKSTPEESFSTAARMREYMTRRGVTISAAQQTKTKSALEFYASELAGKSGRRAPASAKRKQGG